MNHLKKRNKFFKAEILETYNSDIIKELSSSYQSIFELQKKELFSTQLPHLLRYEDKNSMANSIESRLPFLDFKLVEKSININYKSKINDGWTKYVLRKIISNHLPKEIVWRKAKFGFNSPESLWLRKFQDEMKTAIQTSTILNQWINFSKFNFEELDLRTKWRFYNFAIWEKQFTVVL
jgi:asparagine synthase (glutamine-hydrolysing)